MHKLFSYFKLKGARSFVLVLGAAMAFTPASNNKQIEATKIKFNDMPSAFFEASLGRNDVEFNNNSVEAKIAYPEGKLAAIPDTPEAGVSGTPKPQPQAKPEEHRGTAIAKVSNYTENTYTHKVVQYIIKYAQEYQVNADIMIKIAQCESGLREDAVNGPFGGIYQFLASTWSSNRSAMGLDPNPNLRFNAQEAARTAAFKMSRDGFGAWPACSKKAIREI